jgi:hypothetical protein
MAMASGEEAWEVKSEKLKVKSKEAKKIMGGSQKYLKYLIFPVSLIFPVLLIFMIIL